MIFSKKVIFWDTLSEGIIEYGVYRLAELECSMESWDMDLSTDAELLIDPAFDNKI